MEAMRSVYSVCILLVVIISALLSCKKDPVIAPVDELHYVELTSPYLFPELIIPADNPTSIEGIALGRQLYYDPILSNTGQSCSSCHIQLNGFSEETSNSMTHANLAWNTVFLRNGKIEGTLEEAMVFEVDEFFQTTISNLQNNDNYRQQFKKVFGVDQITSEKVAFALAQFLRTMISSDSRYDKYRRGELVLTPQEFEGMDIFFTERGDCFHCHSNGLFSDNSFHNIGLDQTFNGTNWGRYEITANSADIGKFKTPSLRNIELSAPYMHDGRFQTLEAVIDFYNSEVHQGQYTDPIMTKPGKEFGLQLSSSEKLSLIQFLKALTDTAFMHNNSLGAP